MRILFIGDIVGPPGVTFVRAGVAGADRRASSIDLVIANAENAANGSGLTPSALSPAARGRRRSRHAGRSHLQEGGDHPHAGKGRPHLQAGQLSARRARAASSPWRTARDGTPVAVFCVLGRTFMRAGRLSLSRRRPRAGGAGRPGARASSSTCTPRRRRTSTCWAIISRAASAPCSARTPTSRPPTSRSCPAAPRSSATWA